VVDSASNPNYRPDLDGLRAVAVIAVVGLHAAPRAFPGGWIGVDIFFVLSGFLISGIILRQMARGNFRWLDFYARRIKRIFPALILMLITVWVLGWMIFLPDEFQRLGKDITAGASFVLNFVWHAHINQYYRGAPIVNHLWSLGVEEQFYLVWPLFLLAIWNSRKGRFAMIAAITALSLGASALTASHDALAPLLPWNRLWELSTGSALAHAQLLGIRKPAQMPEKPPLLTANWAAISPKNLQAWIGAILLLAAIADLIPGLSGPIWRQLAAVSGTTLLICAPPRNVLSRYVLASTPMIYIGLVSYPLYLWHFPLLEITQMITRPRVMPAMIAGAVLVAFLLSVLTYEYVEIPIRSSPNTTRIATLLCVLMIGCATAGYLTRGIPPRGQPPAVQAFARATVEDWLPYTHDTVWTEMPDGLLRLGGGSLRVLFIGDSNMQQYYPRIAKILADHEQNTHGAVFAVRDWCAPGAIEIAQVTESMRQSCKSYLRGAIEYANDPNVDTIVVSACWYLYFVDFGRVEYFGEAGPLKPDTDLALGSLERILRRFVNSGKRVYLILNMPMGIDFDPHQMILRAFLTPAFRIAVRYPDRAKVVHAVDPINSKLRRIARDTGARIVDPLTWLCNGAVCPAISPEGEPLYHDMWRLRPGFVREKVSFLDDILLNDNAGIAKPLTAGY
jgi:peptidoglycan/LPS O-acetylase OafA/YrhL